MRCIVRHVGANDAGNTSGGAPSAEPKLPFDRMRLMARGFVLAHGAQGAVSGGTVLASCAHRINQRKTASTSERGAERCPIKTRPAATR
jgi:hypothetical protein